MLVALQLVGVAVVPLNFTVLVDWVLMKLVPVIVIGWFTCALDDDNNVSVGGPRSVKVAPALVTLLGLVTLTGPVEVFAGTRAWILVLLQLSMAAMMSLAPVTAL